MKNFKKFLFEDIEIERKEDELIAKATGKESEYFTKLGKKVLEVQAAQKKLDELLNELQGTLKEDIRKIFSNASDETKTRIVETMSVVIMLTKTPEPRKVVKWKEVVDELIQLLSGLESRIEEIIQKHTKYVDVEPYIRVTAKDPASLFKEEASTESSEEPKGEVEAPKKVSPIEQIKIYYSKLKKWFKKFDLKLMSVKRKIRKYGLTA